MGIQGNKYKLSEPNFFIFNIYDIMAGKYLDSSKMFEFCEKYKLTTVPLIAVNYSLPSTIDELVEISKGDSTLYKPSPREGLVFRSAEECYDEDLGRLSFKVVNPLFLLKYGE